MSSAIGKTWESIVGNTQPGPLDPEFRPAPVAGVSLNKRGNDVVSLQVVPQDAAGLDPNLMATDTAIALDGKDGEAMTRIHALLDGSRTLVQVAREADWNVEDCSSFIQRLYEQGAIPDAAARPAPALSYYHHLVAIGRRALLGALDRSPLVSHMLGGSLTKRLVVGYLTEEYHLVASAASHVGPTISATSSTRLQMMFSDYLSGEYWHCLLLKKGLLAAGVTEAELALADPLPGTLAIINQQRYLAHSDLLAYGACLSINEGGDTRGAEAFGKLYDQLTQFVPAEALAPSREHAEIDFQDDHDALGAEPFAEEVSIGGARQVAIYRAVMARVDAQATQHREMAAYYGTVHGPLVHSYTPPATRGWA